MKKEIIEKELSYKLVGIFFEIQRELGRFCRERQYADAFEEKLKTAKIGFKRECPIEVAGRKSNFVDFFIEDKIFVDLKSKPFFEKSDFFQMKRYLETSGIKLGLLVNFRDKYLKPKRVLNSKSNFVDSHQFVVSHRSGQSLIEILIALAVGSILIGAAALGIAFMIRSTSTNQNLQTASGLLRETVEKLRSWSGSDWQNTYSLTKGLTTKYFLNASSTTFYAVEGVESIWESEVRGGLIGRWGLDESTGTIAYDMSGNNNNGILYGVSRATSSLCKASNCGFFDSNYIDLDNSSILQIKDFTVSGWIYASSIGDNLGVITKTTSADRQGWAIVIQTTNKLNFYVGTPWVVVVSDDNFLASGQWIHFAVVKTGTAVNFYKNGVAWGTKTLSNDISDATLYNLQIGRLYTDTSNYYFPGYIDDVRMYNRTLSVAEITRLASDRIFTRYFSVENTCRSTEATSTIGTTPCSIGYFEDPSTQKVTANVRWQTTQTIAELKIIDFLTRWKNEVFHQQDWSGGSGYEGPFTVPNNKFATSTSNINIDSQGSIKVQ